MIDLLYIGNSSKTLGFKNFSSFYINITLSLLLNLQKSPNRLDIRQFLVLLYDCTLKVKHNWSIYRLLKNAIVLNSRVDKNPTTALYSETKKPGRKF